jgi:hypothetical protein
MPSTGGAPVPINPFLGLEEDVNAVGHVICDEGRDADAEIDQHSLLELVRDAAGDDDLWLHRRPHVLATR